MMEQDLLDIFFQYLKLDFDVSGCIIYVSCIIMFDFCCCAGRIVSGLMLLLADSSLLPINVEDYVEEIQKAFGNFMAHYQEDLHRANLSIGKTVKEMKKKIYKKMKIF